LDLWDWDGTIERIHHALYIQSREQAGREASPTTAIIDAQSAKGAVKRMARPVGKWFFSSGFAICENVSGFSARLLAKMEIRAS
jgi:hypothetical protein